PAAVERENPGGGYPAPRAAAVTETPTLRARCCARVVVAIRLPEPLPIRYSVFGPGWRGSDAIRSTTSARSHHVARRRGRRMAARGARAAVRTARHRVSQRRIVLGICSN